MANLELLLAAILFFVLGLPALIWPYESAKLGEQLDAIGSSRRMAEVEPAGWKVSLTKLMGIVLSGGGLVAAVVSFV
jgi:ribose/xylose/arabinose/galactoside ABC-type transport system permease subunit